MKPNSLYSKLWIVIGGAGLTSAVCGWLAYSAAVSPNPTASVWLPLLGLLSGATVAVVAYRAFRSQPAMDIESQAKFAAIDKAFATIEFALDGTVITANQAMLDTLGYTLEEICGKDHSILVDPEYAATDEYRRFWEDLNAGKLLKGEFKRVNRSGEAIFIDAVYSPLRDASGQLSKVVKYATDVTQQVIDREEGVKLRRIVEDSDAAFMMVDRDFTVTYVNQATTKLLLKHQNLLRSMWPAFDATKMVGVCIDQFHKDPSHQRRMLSDPSRLPYKTDIKLGPLTISLNVTATYDSKGDYVGNTLEWEDVTEDRMQEVRDADFRGQIAAISRSQLVIEFDLDGTIRDANDKFLSVFGYTKDDLEGKHHRVLVEPSRASATEYRQFWDSLGAGNPVSGEYKLFGKGDAELWLQASYNPILDVNGKPLKIVAYANDITTSKEVEFEVADRSRRDAQQADEQARKVDVVLGIVNAIADGDFGVSIPDLGRDAVGKVAEALGQATSSMREALSEVRDVARTVEAAAEQLSASSTEITNGAQTQASSLEETASSLEEITSTVKQNTDNAQQARQVAAGSRDVAEKGGDVVNSAVTAMGEINSASKKIADIITTIDEIAFQTNLLALNAAVEAARAGEQGRGFAVVAGEVRNLAQRSATAAKEIKSLIQDSVGKVENGTELVNKSGETLSEIVSSVKRVTDIVAEIAAASKEQLSGVEQVNSAVAQMDQITQGNAAQTEQMSGTASALLKHSNRLNSLVKRFNLGSSGGSGSTSHYDDELAHQTADEPVARNAPVAAPTFEEVAGAADVMMEF